MPKHKYVYMFTADINISMADADINTIFFICLTFGVGSALIHMLHSYIQTCSEGLVSSLPRFDSRTGHIESGLIHSLLVLSFKILYNLKMCLLHPIPVYIGDN